MGTTPSLLMAPAPGISHAQIFEMQRQQQQQMEQQAAESRKTLESIMNKNAADQKEALKMHHQQSEKALKQQQDMFNRMENERKEAAKKEMNIVRVSFGKLKV